MKISKPSKTRKDKKRRISQSLYETIFAGVFFLSFIKKETPEEFHKVHTKKSLRESNNKGYGGAVLKWIYLKLLTL